MEVNSSRKSPISTKAIVAISLVVVVGSTAIYASLNPTRSYRAISNSGESVVPQSMILNGSVSGGFFNNQLVSFGYTAVFTCSPDLSKFSSNRTETGLASGVTGCEVGGGNSSAVSGAAPVFILVPAFAGLSIFGVPSLGASSQGYPMFGTHLVFTQCGAGGTVSACKDHPTYIYSPFFTAVEQRLGIRKGYGGLPEGVLPTPAHDHVVDYEGGPSIPWDVITVLVFDPNVMPDGSTGQCQKLVASNLTDPTHNCLTSFSALASSLFTKTNANANANSSQNDPIYDALGAPTTQVVIPGVTMVTDSSPANTNIFLYFNVQASDPFGK